MTRIFYLNHASLTIIGGSYSAYVSVFELAALMRGERFNALA